MTKQFYFHSYISINSFAYNLDQFDLISQVKLCIENKIEKKMVRVALRHILIHFSKQAFREIVTEYILS